MRGKHPEELERGNNKAVISHVVLPGLAEADEAEATARGIADREVASHALAVQVLVAVFYLYGVHGPAHGQRESRAQAVIHTLNACGANAKHGLSCSHLVNAFPLNRLHLRGRQVACANRVPHQAEEIVLYLVVHIT